MTFYNKKTTCGELIVEIKKRKNGYNLSSHMRKFGDCSAYKFISKLIEDKINSGVNIKEIIKELQRYKCKIGHSGCIESIGNCLKEFILNKK